MEGTMLHHRRSHLKKIKVTKRGYIKGCNELAPPLPDGYHLYLGEVEVPGCSFVYAWQVLARNYTHAKQQITPQVRELFGVYPRWAK
jgi:hypothetical protein